MRKRKGEKDRPDTAWSRHWRDATAKKTAQHRHRHDMATWASKQRQADRGVDKGRQQTEAKQCSEKTEREKRECTSRRCM